MRTIPKPDPKEYANHASQYIDLLPDDGLVLQHLENNFFVVKKLIYSLPEEKLLYRYAEKKWSIKEVLIHMVDDERIYAYRSLCFARNEAKPLPGFDEKDYAYFSKADERSLQNIFEEYEAVRRATITLFNGLPEESFSRTGIGDSRHSSVRAMVYHIAGHELHHLSIIRDRYLKNN